MANEAITKEENIQKKNVDNVRKDSPEHEMETQDQKRTNEKYKEKGKSAKERKKEVKDNTRRSIAIVTANRQQRRQLNNEIAKKEAHAANAMKEVSSCYKSAKSATEIEEKNKYIQKGDEAFKVWKQLDQEIKREKTELSIIDSRMDGAQYAIWQKKKAFLNVLNRTESFFVRFWKEHSLIYRAYRAVSDRIWNARMKMSHTNLLEQYDEVRKDQKIAAAEDRLAADILPEVEKCLNDDRLKEIEKIEELAQLCGKTRATIIAQLNDKEILQFRFNPDPLSLKDGMVELSKRDILRDENGETVLGKEKKGLTIAFQRGNLQKLAESQRRSILKHVYGQEFPDLKESMLQVADMDIYTALRKELRKDLEDAKMWDPKKERAAEREERAAGAKTNEPRSVIKEQNIPENMEEKGISEKTVEEKDAVEKAAEEKNSPEMQKPEKEQKPTAFTMNDIIYARVDIEKMSDREKGQIYNNLTMHIRSGQKKNGDIFIGENNSFKPNSEPGQDAKPFSKTALVNKIMSGEMVYVSEIKNKGKEIEPGAFYSKNYNKDNKESYDKVFVQNDKGEKVPLTYGYIKSDKFLSDISAAFKERNEKDSETIRSVMSGEKSPKDVQNYETRVSRSIRNMINHNGAPVNEGKDVQPVVVQDRRTLVEKVQNGEVLFSCSTNGDFVDGEKKKPNRLLLDKETGAKLVYIPEGQEKQTAWSEHDISVKTFVNELRAESEKVMENEKEQSQVQEQKSDKNREPESSKEPKAEKSELNNHFEPEKQEEEQHSDTGSHQEEPPHQEKSSDEYEQDDPAQPEEKANKENADAEISSSTVPTLEEKKPVLTKEDFERIRHEAVSVNEDGYLLDENDEPVCWENYEMKVSDLPQDSQEYKKFENMLEQMNMESKEMNRENKEQAEIDQMHMALNHEQEQDEQEQDEMVEYTEEPVSGGQTPEDNRFDDTMSNGCPSDCHNELDDHGSYDYNDEH